MTIFHFIVEFILLGLGFLGGFFYRKYVMDSHQQSLEALGKKILDEARKEAESLRKEAKLQAKDQLLQMKMDFEKETHERRHELNQLERRISHSRAMKRAVQQALRIGAEGIKITCSGRLAGSEMARRETVMEGRVPRSTLRADIDFARSEALTTYGRIGIKVWIYKGEILTENKEQPAPRMAPIEE